jgi:hypothetical protein
VSFSSRSSSTAGTLRFYKQFSSPSTTIACNAKLYISRSTYKRRHDLLLQSASDPNFHAQSLAVSSATPLFVYARALSKAGRPPSEAHIDICPCDNTSKDESGRYQLAKSLLDRFVLCVCLIWFLHLPLRGESVQKAWHGLFFGGFIMNSSLRSS